MRNKSKFFSGEIEREVLDSLEFCSKNKNNAESILGLSEHYSKDSLDKLNNVHIPHARTGL